MKKARHRMHEAVFVAVAAMLAVVVLSLIDVPLGVIAAIMLIGLLVVIVPLVSIFYDEHNEDRLTH